MTDHIIDGEFQSDKYPTTPRGKVPLSVKDKSAQDLLWQYAQRRRAVDAEFADDLESCLRASGYTPPPVTASNPAWIEACARHLCKLGGVNPDAPLPQVQGERIELNWTRFVLTATAALSVLTPLIEAETVERCTRIVGRVLGETTAYALHVNTAIRSAFPLPSPVGGEAK